MMNSLHKNQEVEFLQNKSDLAMIYIIISFFSNLQCACNVSVEQMAY